MMTVRDLRGEVAKCQKPLYQLAAEVGVHPSRLGQMLRERIPMPPDLVTKVQSALGEAAQECRSR
jgi:DNA-binding transcriptional regulator YdaS (Cro superfamily)